MTRPVPRREQTPDEQRAARDKRWAQNKSMHWRPNAPTADTQVNADDEDRARGAKPTDIPSRAPADDSD
ncbi:hypothetical protein [Microbacterium cremeum]|uniref:hypothetical protein n=1 Tax=Microbacterium cremeum TaxID=2782169 RepID=UPI001887CCD4|nr:hypothetical protein [Microbacterium cremeum]